MNIETQEHKVTSRIYLLATRLGFSVGTIGIVCLLATQHLHLAKLQNEMEMLRADCQKLATEQQQLTNRVHNPPVEIVPLAVRIGR